MVDNLAWTQTPTAADMDAAFPTQAIGHTVSGHVLLHCHVLASGELKDCDTSSEEPAALGFAKAAHGLTKAFKARVDPDLVTKDNNLYVNLPIDLRDPHAPAPPLQIVDPDWLQGPDLHAAGQIYPAQAANAGVRTGLGVVDCAVAHNPRALVDLQSASCGRTPPGWALAPCRWP